MFVHHTYVRTKVCNKCKKELDRSMFTVDRRNSDGLQGKCNVCRSEVKKAHYAANLEKMRAEKRKYHHSLSEDKKQARRERKNETRDRVQTLVDARKRQAGIKRAAVLWADPDKIKEIYKDAAEFRAAGLDVHVDHVIPLKGKLVCGLHVEGNLTIMLAKKNGSKGNKYGV